jgi:hypothetical protein
VGHRYDLSHVGVLGGIQIPDYMKLLGSGQLYAMQAAVRWSTGHIWVAVEVDV